MTEFQNKDKKLVEKLLAVSLLIIVGVQLVTSQYGNYADLQGDYCRNRVGHDGQCCSNRVDSCSLPILGTLCYCDEFCNRTGNPDCCPDYWNVCLGVATPDPLGSDCMNGNRKLPHGSSFMDNCNKCKCTYGSLACEKDECLINDALLRSLESSRLTNGWTPSNYSKFWGKKLDEGLMMLTGTYVPDERSLRMHPIKLHYDEEQLPRSFDARAKWDHLGGIRDQGWCAASWAFSTVSVAEDRLTIASDHTEVVELSPQNLLSCNRRGQQACKGGHVERAWGYLKKFGIVTEECYPYTSGFNGASESCTIRRDDLLQSIDCPRKEFPMDRTEFYSTEPAYRIASTEGDIMWELMTNGPVQALMRVYQDFFLYKSGVYSRSNPNGNGKYSVHSVKLLGWGEDPSYYGPPTKYWLAANSWGYDWGLDGTFKIRRGTNESDIEQFILAVRSHLAKEARTVNRRKTRLQGRRKSTRRQF